MVQINRVFLAVKNNYKFGLTSQSSSA